MINKNYQRYYSGIPNNNPKSNFATQNSNQQIDKKDCSHSYQKPANNCTGYVSNSNIYQKQGDQFGYSNSTGIYDVGTMMFVKSGNNMPQYQNSFNNNNNQNMYQNNNINNSGQNMQQFNNQYYQRMNNSGQNMQQNYYNQNSQNLQQNNFNMYSHRKNYSNLQQHFMNNNQNIQNNNSNLNTQRNYNNPNMTYFNNNNPNNYQNAQRSHIQMPQAINNNMNLQNLQYNGSSRHRGYTQNIRRYNNNPYPNIQMNNNNYQNNQIPNQYNNPNYINQQFNNNQNNNQKNVNQQTNNGRNINNHPNKIQNNNPQKPIESHQINKNNIQNLANDMQNKLKIEDNNKNSEKDKEKDENNAMEKEKDSDNLIYKINNLEDDNIMSVAESINIDLFYDKKKNQINNDKKTDVPKNKDNDDKKESKNLPMLKDHISSDSKTINDNLNKDKKDDDEEEDDNPYRKDTINDDNDNPFLKDITGCGDNFFPLNYTKTIYTIDEEQAKTKDNQFLENNNNAKEEENKGEEVNKIFLGNPDNDYMLPGESVVESVNVDDELPSDIHEHPLSNEPLKNERCTICNEEKSCDKGYKCPKCPLIICEVCSINITIEYYSHFKHEHSLCLINEGNFECNVCKQQTDFVTYFFNCKKCKFNICLKCFIPERKKDHCALHEHPLKYYNESDQIKCKICDKDKKCGYKCNNCKAEICQKCAYNICSHNKRYELHEHPLYLTLRDKWNCFICQCGFRNNISFCCEKCSLDFCVDCFLES